MIPVVLVTHGDFAKGLIESSEMLVGKSEGLSYVTLEPSDDFSAFKQKIENEIKAVDGSDGVLLLADLLGGSPYNAAAMCTYGMPDSPEREHASHRTRPERVLRPCGACAGVQRGGGIQHCDRQRTACTGCT